jgi:arabinose-5-phosphate isomerase
MRELQLQLFFLKQTQLLFLCLSYICKKQTLQKKIIIQAALNTIAIETKSIEGLADGINDVFASAVELIHQNKGRVVISGIGKSAIIAQKIVATLNSTGTPSLFLHAADAIHGDLGMLQPDDIAIVISKSGESAEIKVLVPFIKGFGNKLIALCGSEHSFLATQADFFINCSVDEEACPNNLAPTSSTTAQLVMGDAIAVSLLKLKGFQPSDFAKYHPGGALGKRLYMKVSDLSSMNAKPQVLSDADIKETILEITQKRLGACAVVNSEAHLEGIVTDGDIRRMLEKYENWLSLKACDIMNSQPKSIEETELAVNALEKMRSNNISQLIVLKEGKYAGIIHLHDLIREGII